MHQKYVQMSTLHRPLMYISCDIAAEYYSKRLHISKITDLSLKIYIFLPSKHRLYSNVPYSHLLYIYFVKYVRGDNVTNLQTMFGG